MELVSIRGNSKEELRREIEALGFDEVRFTDLEPLESNRLREWVELGYHADMEWLKRSIEKRLDPSLVMEEACSVIMLGVNYLPGEEPALSQSRWGKYSLYLDYHDTLLSGLKAVGRLLEEHYDLDSKEYRYYTDTGPVMERGWAAASGMGWQGKNGMLISKKHGNWLLLATVLTKLKIEPDPPLKKKLVAKESKGAEMGLLCGKCERCIEACPTDAIVEPGLLDANLCISYQTIENKGIIPRELRHLFGSRIFGCDICLDVCPWNRFAREGRRLLLVSRFQIASLSLLDILRMDTEEFRECFRKTPIKRLKLRGLLRNACIVAGNLHENDEWWPSDSDDNMRSAWLGEVRDELTRLCSYEETMVRPHALWALFRLFGQEAVVLIGDAIESEKDPATLEEYAYWVS